MNKQAYATIGSRLARRFFELRKRKNAPQVEIHVSQDQLAAMLALAVEEGVKLARGEPRTLSLISGPPRFACCPFHAQGGSLELSCGGDKP